MEEKASGDAVCVVTGGGRGIGRAIVERFLEGGLRVHSIDIDHPKDDAPRERLSRHDLDITDLAAVEQVFHAIGAADILVNNAATVTRAVPITELAPHEWQKAISINITGLFNVTRTALAAMPGGGSIVNLASTFAHVGSPGRVAYSTTKGAVLAFTRSLALDVAPRGIRVNSVSPGGIATDRLIELFGSQQAADDYLIPLHPIGRTGHPADIANAVWFLASPQSSFMTGAELLVDGGYTAQ